MWRSSANNVGVLQPVAGARAPLQLVNGKLGKWLTITIEADVVISVAAATSIRNRGRASALADELLLIENGENRWEVTGKALRMAAEANSPSALGNVALTSTAVGTTHVKETVRMFFRSPLTARPDETAFIERDQRQGLYFSIRQIAAPAAAMVVAGGATVAVNNFKATVTQEWHTPDAQTVAPYFIPTVRQSILAVPGAATQLPMYFRNSNNIRSIVVSQEGDGNEVSDIINALTLRGDSLTILGPNQIPWTELLAQSEMLYGGAVRPTNDSHLFLGFTEDGLLSNTLSPRQDTNLRFEFNCQPSAGGAAVSQIRATFFELEHTPGITSPVPFQY